MKTLPTIKYLLLTLILASGCTNCTKSSEPATTAKTQKPQEQQPYDMILVGAIGPKFGLLSPSKYCVVPDNYQNISDKKLQDSAIMYVGFEYQIHEFGLFPPRGMDRPTVDSAGDAIVKGRLVNDITGKLGKLGDCDYNQGKTYVMEVVLPYAPECIKLNQDYDYKVCITTMSILRQLKYFEAAHIEPIEILRVSIVDDSTHIEIINPFDFEIPSMTLSAYYQSGYSDSEESRKVQAINPKGMVSIELPNTIMMKKQPHPKLRGSPRDQQMEREQISVPLNSFIIYGEFEHKGQKIRLSVGRAMPE